MRYHVSSPWRVILGLVFLVGVVLEAIFGGHLIWLIAVPAAGALAASGTSDKY